MMNRPSGNFIRVAADNWTLEESLTGKPFVPVGCNYYDASTGWPPQMWRRFDRATVSEDFARMEDLGLTAIRLWVQWASFMPDGESLSIKALDHCNEVLQLASRSGIRVNLTGPEFWEGTAPCLSGIDTTGYLHLANPEYHRAHGTFWEQLAAQFAESDVVYAFDLANEPFMPWDCADFRSPWNNWLESRYSSKHALRKAWGRFLPPSSRMGQVAPPPPPNRRIPRSQYLLDYQTFREDMALRWIRSTVESIRRVNPHHCVTVGLHQSGNPLEESIPSRYTAFNPRRLSTVVDYLSLHWYPFGNPLTAGQLPFELPGSLEQSLSTFLAGCRYHAAGKPLILEEFSYYGGGSPRFWGGILPARSEKEQNLFSRTLIRISRGSIGGWLNWPLRDTREATDTSAFGGLYAASGDLKAWGKSFGDFARKISRTRLKRTPGHVRIPITRSDLLTDWGVCHGILERCRKLYSGRVLWDFEITD